MISKMRLSVTVGPGTSYPVVRTLGQPCGQSTGPETGASSPGLCDLANLEGDRPAPVQPPDDQSLR